MNIFQRVKLFAQSIERFFRKSRITYVPSVHGGMWVDHETALCLSAVFSAVRFISESVASLPWELRQRRSRGMGSDPALTNNVYRLLHTRPNPYMGAFVWRVLMVSLANLWGNAYAEIEKDVIGRPLALWPIHPSRVNPRMDNGELYYEITQRNLEKKDMLNPLYKKFMRLGCWLCPKQNEDSLYILFRDYPELWQKLLKYEQDSPVSFKPVRWTLKEKELEFIEKSKQLGLL